MRCELLIIFCVSFLNSLTVERGSNDRILMVSEDECEDTFYGEDEEDYPFCECSGRKNTFLSQDNDQYRCRNEDYLRCKETFIVSKSIGKNQLTSKNANCPKATSIKIWNLQSKKEKYGKWFDYKDNLSECFKISSKGSERKLVFDGLNARFLEGHLLKVTIPASNDSKSNNLANGECYLIKFQGSTTYPADLSRLFASNTSTKPNVVPTSFTYTRNNTENSHFVTTKRISTLKNNSIGELPRNDHSKDNNIVTVTTATICVVLLIVIVAVGVFLWVKRKRLPKGSVASNMKKFVKNQFIGHPDRLKPKESGEIIYATLEEQQEDQKIHNYDEVRSYQENHIYREIDQNSVCQTPALPNKVDNQDIHSEGKVKQYTSLNPIAPEPYQTLRSSLPQNQVDEKESSNKNNRDDYTPLTKINEKPYEQLCKSDHHNDNGSLPQYRSNTLYEELEPTPPLYKTLEALDSNCDFS